MNSTVPEIERGISVDQANIFLEIASAKAIELGFEVKDFHYSIKRIDEGKLYVPYYNQIMLEKLRDAIRKEKDLFQVNFYPKALANGGVIWGGGLSVYMNKVGKIVALERTV
jgi:hypothetical protein